MRTVHIFVQRAVIVMVKEVFLKLMTNAAVRTKRAKSIQRISISSFILLLFALKAGSHYEDLSHSSTILQTNIKMMSSMMFEVR